MWGDVAEWSEAESLSYEGEEVSGEDMGVGRCRREVRG